MLEASPKFVGVANILGTIHRYELPFGFLRSRALADVRHRKEAVEDERERTLQTRPDFEGGATNRHMPLARGEESPPRLCRQNWLDEPPGLCDLAADHDDLGVEPVDEPRDAGAEIACRFTHRFDRRGVARFDQLDESAHRRRATRAAAAKLHVARDGRL